MSFSFELEKNQIPPSENGKNESNPVSPLPQDYLLDFPEIPRLANMMDNMNVGPSKHLSVNSNYSITHSELTSSPGSMSPNIGPHRSPSGLQHTMSMSENPNYVYTNPEQQNNFVMPNGFPQPQFGFSQPGYPPQQNGYPPQQNGYPPQQNGYPPQQDGSQTPNNGFSPNPYGYPQQPGGYQTPNNGYPQQPGCQTPNNGYPQQGYQAPNDGYPQQGYQAPNDGYQQQQNVNNANPPPQNQVGFGVCRDLCFKTQLLTETEVKDACTQIREAIQTYSSSNDGKLIQALSKYPPIQMDQIINCYKNEYNKKLEDAVKEKTSGNFGKLCVALSKSILDYDAWLCRTAIEGIGTNEDCLIDVLIGRTNYDMITLCKAYKETYKVTLEKDIRGDTSGNFRDYLVSIVQGNRNETNLQRDVESDVDALYEAGEGRLGTDERSFITIFCNRSDDHLKKVFEEYEKKYKSSAIKAIKGEFSGDIKKSLLAQVKIINNRFEYIAEEFEKSMKGLGTRNEKLIRLTVRYRDPALMIPIKEAYMKLYGKTLKSRIEGDTSGSFRKLLVACID